MNASWSVHTAGPAVDEPVAVEVPWWRVVVTRAAVTLGAGVLLAGTVVAIHLSRLEIPQVPAATAVAVVPVAPSPEATEAPVSGDASPVAAVVSPVERVDPAWAASVAAATGIPVRALLAYASADLTVRVEQPRCGLGWNTLAGIGAVESGHGTHRGSVLGSDGYATPAIVGPVLDGSQFAAVPDSDGGRWDGDGTWDRAVGPMQFLPSTWARWGADGNGDGVADPNQVDDAALAAGRYLCASGSMTTGEGWRRAVFSYNHDDGYVDQVARLANEYAAGAGS